MQKLNNRGFTVVELLASFTLTMLIVVFLFEIVLELKDVYVNSSLKTQVINKNALVTSALNSRIETKRLESATCDNAQKTCTLIYTNGSAIETITIMETKIQIGTTPTAITQTIEYPAETTLENIDVSVGTNNVATDMYQENKFFKISYKVVNPNLTKDVDYNFIYLYRG